MRAADNNTLKMNPRTGTRREAARKEEMEMHLFDAEAAVEKVPCGKDTTRIERMGVRDYVNFRLYDNRHRTVCQDCKVLAMPRIEVILEGMAQDFEDGGRLGDAEDCRELLDRLARETDLDR